MTSLQKDIPNVLTIAGSDNSGGAGIQADIRTFTQLGVYSATAITSITSQTNEGVIGKADVDESTLRSQIKSVLESINIDAIKIGMLANKNNTIAVSELLNDQAIPIVIDPVIVSTSGKLLLESDALETLKSDLIPKASLFTPNINEAALLLSTEKRTIERQPEQHAKLLFKRFNTPVLLKGGHNKEERCTDIFFDGKHLELFTNIKIITENTHGTGCSLSSAITAYLAKGCSLLQAIDLSIQNIHQAIKHSNHLSIYKKGYGSINHFVINSLL